MVRSIRRLRAACAAVVLVLGTTLPVLAAEPEPLLDGRVTVSFALPGGDPIAGAEVTLTARDSDLPEVPAIQELTGTTGTDGTAVFEGVARPAPEGPPIELTALALLVETDDDGGCPTTTTYRGSVSGAAAEEVDMQITALVEAVGGGCPVVAVTGVVSGPDGLPFAVDDARFTFLAPAGGGALAEVVEVGPDGSFRLVLPGWGTADEPARLDLVIVGLPTVIELRDDGCSDRYGPVAAVGLDLALADGTVPEPLDVRAEEVLLGTVCGGIGTPVPTLPPTDAPGPGADRDPSGAGGLAVLGMAALAAASLVLGGRRRPALSRRGS